MWARLMSSTNQPNFEQYSDAIQEQRKQNASKQAGAPALANGSSKATANGNETKEEPTEVIQTGNRTGLPMDRAEASLLTAPVPGDPTADLDPKAW